MAFGLNANTFTNNAEISGKQIKIACLCWFTSTGKARPLKIKVEDEDGQIQTLDTHVDSFEEKNYCGIPATEYKCTIMICNVKRKVKLIYFKQDGNWTMVV